MRSEFVENSASPPSLEKGAPDGDYRRCAGNSSAPVRRRLRPRDAGGARSSRSRARRLHAV